MKTISDHELDESFDALLTHYYYAMQIGEWPCAYAVRQQVDALNVIRHSRYAQEQSNECA